MSHLSTGLTTTNWFIDKLNVWQTHSDTLPFLGKTGAIDFDLFTGETDDVLKIKGKYPVMSSFSTSVRVHCNGSRVYVEGNPSRFGRMENLLGFETFEECIAVYNKILDHVGLPHFTTGRFEFLQGKENEAQRKLYTGAHFSHVDITKNHSVGAENCYQFLRALSSLSLPNGKHPFLYPNGATVDFSSSKSGRGSSWDYTKFYIKHVDLIDKQKSNVKGGSSDDIEYYEKVIQHCKNAGIIREEHSFKSKKLTRYDLQYYGFVDINRLVNHKTLTTLEKLTQTLEVATMDYTTIADQLLANGVCGSRQSANASQSWAMSWMHNPHFHQVTPKNNNFYVHKKRLLTLGLDISIPFRTDRNVLPMIKNQREITRRDHNYNPNWYRAPTTNNLILLTA
ncbi:phage/plasmid replication protein [Rheinheimera sp. MMS21-TC3]|uniref:phage/plasmid replication domain-containing protein n=1 Tax=Rheinheimera sp. MMS21-TC3 TaxID=3072790 RepID=UPI0028C4B710|nr:phage/plasmid replication protein [Rheinheimera sp. MMS21-TC3]WNO61087.1 phage/plasmid replication protein [Rheinheimera sp. MMS21-TC3]